MPATITPTLRSAVERLKHSGSISGICFGWRRQLLLNLTPYQDFRAERLLDLLHDTHGHFTQGDRDVGTLWFGFDGVFVLAVLRGDCTLILFHTRAHEVDFIKQAATTLLEDCQLLIQSLLNPGEDEASGADTQQISEDQQHAWKTNLVQHNA